MLIVQLILAAGLFLVGWAAFSAGLFVNALWLFILAMAFTNTVVVIVRAARHTLETGFWKKPAGPERRRFWLQVANRSVFWLAAALIFQACIIPAQFAGNEHRMLLGLTWGAALLSIGLTLLPGKRVLPPLNVLFAIGTLFMGWQAVKIVSTPSLADGVVLTPPFRGEWNVMQGGSSALINHHYRIQSQRYALDLTKLQGGHDRTGSREKLESYPSWGALLYAPCDGRVAVVVNDLPGNAMGQTDRKHLAGNHVTIEMADGRFVLFAHLQEGSIMVSPGDHVRVGQPLARCGNSGNTSQPHLHLQVQDNADFSLTGRTWPIFFRDTRSLRDGMNRADAPFFLRRNDRLIQP